MLMYLCTPQCRDYSKAEREVGFTSSEILCVIARKTDFVERSPDMPLIAQRRRVVLDSAARSIGKLFDFIEELQFWVKDHEGYYCVVNRGFLLNYALANEDQIIGKTDFDVEPIYIALQLRADDERVLAGETIRHRIELVGRYDHTAVWSITDKVPLYDPQGKIIGTTGISRPLREQEKISVSHADPQMARVVDYLRIHLQEQLDNRTLAEIAELSVRAFERRFLAVFHLTPQKYLRRLRVRTACQALVYSDRSLADIAVAHGFCDQSHFGREFRRETSLSPRAYREAYRVPS